MMRIVMAKRRRLAVIGSGLLFVFVASPLTLPGFAGSVGIDSALDFLQNAHRCAVQALRTISCDVKVEDGPPEHPKTFATGHYCRSDDRVRITYRKASNGHMEELLISNSEERSIGREAPHKGGAVSGVVSSGSRRRARDAHPFCDVWRAMLLTFPSGHIEWLSLDRLLERATKPAHVKKVTENGKEYLQLTITFDDMNHRENQIDIWFDPTVNYLARKAVVLDPKKGRVRFEVLDFVEAGPGLFMPRESTMVAEAGPPRMTRFSLSNVRVNEPMPDNTFELPIPAGTTIFDQIDGKVYKVDAQGKPVGAGEDIAKPEVTIAETETPRTQSRTDRVDWTNRVFLFCSASVLLTAAALWLVRRRRETRSIPRH
jgi:hypothetical protein